MTEGAWESEADKTARFMYTLVSRTIVASFLTLIVVVIGAAQF